MKRSNPTLVNYSSSDDAQSDEANDAAVQPASKKRKLPPIASSIATPLPADNPSLHQGRIRTTPHVEGQFAAHVYVSLALGRSSLLYKILQDILSDAKKAVPILNDILVTKQSSQRPELHISLSRPIFLRAHQREDLKKAVKNIARAHKAFVASFAVMTELINDEKTRSFLTLEVGAGHHELCSLANALAPTLRSIRQQEYYVDPKFHASIAWVLLQRPLKTADSPTVLSDQTSPRVTADNPAASLIETTSHGALGGDGFSTVPHLPAEMISSLNEKYGAKLSSPKIGMFVVETITVKIGKETSSWKLSLL